MWIREILTLLLGAGLLALPAAAAPPAGHRLADSGSPYLLRHVDNPVAWHPWGEEALALARRENKPVFLAIGYSTCYWCHVAELTLYRNPLVAQLLNAHFVAIKVDREQRPDIDQLYLQARLLLSGEAGWPNHLFLTPELQPLRALGYLPPEDDSFGQPGFVSLLREQARAWAEQPAMLRALAAGNAARLAARSQAGAALPAARDLQRAAMRAVSAAYDARHGGFAYAGDARFPQAPLLEWLLDQQLAGDAAAGAMLRPTLAALAAGALYDHVGGGFHRYTVDAAWRLPHFEKMLYDNAQLLALFARAHAQTKVPRYRAVALATAGWLMDAMQAADGGFHTAEDAQVDGREGAAHAWRVSEIQAVLEPALARRFLQRYALEPLAHVDDADLLSGDLPGALRLARPSAAAEPAEMAAALARLADSRRQRPQPFIDRKQVVVLNGLAIRGLAVSARLLGRPDHLAAARRAATHLWATAWNADRATLARSVYQGRAQGEGFLEDYAHLALGLRALAEAGGGAVWGERADLLTARLLERFTGADGRLINSPYQDELPLALGETGDHPYPAGVTAALRLLLADGAPAAWQAAGGEALRALAGPLGERPQAWPGLLALAGKLADAGLADSARVVRVSAGYDPADPTRVEVRLDIAPGYHVNAHPPGQPWLIATELAFPGEAAVDYPPGEELRTAFAQDGLRVWSGAVRLRARLAAPAESAVLTVQACSASVCLLPAQLPLRLAPGLP